MIHYKQIAEQAKRDLKALNQIKTEAEKAFDQIKTEAEKALNQNVALSRAGITTIRQLNMILAVAWHPQIDTNQLAEILGATRPGVRATALMLRDKGLIQWDKAPGQSLRVIFSLTRKGREIVDIAKGGAA